MEDIEIGISRSLAAAGRDLVRAATGIAKDGEGIVWLTKDGERVAAIVPADGAKYALRHGWGR